MITTETMAKGALGEPPLRDANAEQVSSEAGADASRDVARSLTPGNPLRWARGGTLALAGSAAAFLFMAHDAQLRWGVPLAALFVAVGGWGIMDFLGTFDDADERVARRTTLRQLLPSAACALAGGVAFGGALYGGQSGVGPQWGWGLVVTGTFLAWVAAVFALGVRLGPWAKDENGAPRPLFHRHGFWVLAAGAGLYLPALGLFTLWDPWESQYAEVARGILGRDDWLSLWWVQESWFWSKPVLSFWMQALAMATLGTHTQADQMLLDASGHATLHPEWVIRAPNVLFALAAMYLLYKGLARAFGRRAGLLGGLVLATVPDWYFLAHQTMTDMPCVAAMTAAMGFLLLGIYADRAALVRVYEVKAGKIAWRLSAWHLVFGAILLTALPQVLYLFSRNLELVLHGAGPHGLRPHWDLFSSGSRGVCGSPGNEPCVLTNPASLPKGLAPDPTGFAPSMHRLFGAFEPVLQGIVWSACLGFVLHLHWGERRVQRLLYLAAWFAASVATMAKGPEGIAIPAVAVLAWIVSTRKWSELLRLEIASGVALWLALVMPWFVAMCVRHGSGFTDRLIFHDMFDRAFNHVHDTNSGDDTSIRFYLWQLGYALFPWTGLAPLGLLLWIQRGKHVRDGKQTDAAMILFLWFLVAFALVSFMGTKFHHYIFPAVPPAAMLTGVALDRLLARPRASHESAMLGAAAVAGALLLALVGRDLVRTSGDQPGAIRLLQLFTYNYARPWPATLDFSRVLTALTTLAAIASAMLASWRWRRHAVVAFGAVAAASAIWAIDVYMVETSRHWGQHELVAAYYESRASADELFVAYNMNWKGEDFYTSNRAPVFASSGATFTTWLKAQREKGTKVMYFVTEPVSVNGLKGEVRARSYREITDKTMNNKFVVVRAEL